MALALEEMYVKLNGEMAYLWHAVHHEGEVTGSFITKTRDKQAALTFMKEEAQAPRLA